MDKVRVGILNLGCPRNLVDAESILGGLSLKGHKITDIDKADIAIINTCAFIEEAKKESIDAILDLVELKKEGRIKKIIVAGCLPQRYKDTLRKQLPEVDAFIGSPALNDNLNRFAVSPKHYAYLKICESCVNSCSYCVIPKIKGKFISLDIEPVLKKVRMLDKQGISELNIIGQDITGFGIDNYGKRKLPDLLRKIVKNSGNIGWIRLLYLYPDKVIEDLLRVIRDEPKVCKYIDLPIQHINNRVLKLMRRRSSKKAIAELIGVIRKELPGAAIRTSVIVGFPSETEKEFQELLDFIKEIKFERLGAFIYSREEGTPAYSFKGQLAQKVKQERFNRVMSAQREVSEENNGKFFGREIDVLIDEKGKDHYLGRSQFDAPEVDGTVFVKSLKPLRPGDFVRVKILDTLEYDLVGEAIR